MDGAVSSKSGQVRCRPRVRGSSLALLFLRRRHPQREDRMGPETSPRNLPGRRIGTTLTSNGMLHNTKDGIVLLFENPLGHYVVLPLVASTMVHSS